MTKKFISLLIAVIMVVGLLPVMSVSAAGGTTYLEDDFQSYDTRVYSSADTPLKVNGTEKWRVNASVKLEVVDMNGADGNATKALKYFNQAGGSGDINSNKYRLTALKDPNHPVALASLAGRVFVQEVDVWLPADIENVDGTTDYKRPYKVNLGYGAVISASYLYVGGTIYTGVKIDSEKWYKVKTVFDFSNYDATNGGPITYTVFVNDKAEYHKKITNAEDQVKPSTNMGYFIISKSYRTSKDIDASGGFNDVYFIMDNLKMYTNPSETTATSEYAGATGIPATVNPTVDFTEAVLDYTVDSDSTFSMDNVKMTNSDGAEIELASVTLSNDKKSIVIKPASKLEKGMKYNIEVVNLKDMFGQTIPAYEFSFTTMEESKISCAKPSFKKENLFVFGNQGTEINALENGYIRTDLIVSNSDTADKEVFVVALLKDNGDIKGFQFDNVTVPASGSADFTCSFQIEDANNQTIETFVWDSFSGKSPLASKWTFTNSGCTETVIEDQ